MARAPLVITLLALFLAPAAGGASQARLGFAAIPTKVFQDKEATVEIVVRPAGARCTLSVRYADGSRQPGLAAVRAVRGRARWTWQVPQSADAGPAKVTASCRGVGSRSRTMVVVGGTTVQARLSIRDMGFTQRSEKYGGGSFVSYGIVLENPAVAYDAVGVGLLINFLNAEGRVLGSKTQSVAGVAAGSEYGVGGSMSLLTQIPVTRLEVVVTASKRMPKALHFPAITAVGIEPASFDAGWVGAVAGEIINEHPRLTLTRAVISIVIRDAAGTIVGGGTASTFTTLLPGTRILWKATSGFKSIPITSASSTQISIEPTWAAPDA